MASNEPHINHNVSWAIVEARAPESQGLWTDWSPEHREVLMARFDELIKKIPPIEADILELTLEGCFQKDIGDFFGVDQVAISYRLRRGIERLKWLVEWPPKPDSWDADITARYPPIPLNYRDRKRTRPGMTVSDDVLPIINTLVRTTSQSLTASELGTNVGRIQHVYKSTLRRLERNGATASLAHLAYLRWNMLAEVHGGAGKLASHLNGGRRVAPPRPCETILARPETCSGSPELGGTC